MRTKKEIEARIKYLSRKPKTRELEGLGYISIAFTRGSEIRGLNWVLKSKEVIK